MFGGLVVMSDELFCQSKKIYPSRMSQSPVVCSCVRRSLENVGCGSYQIHELTQEDNLTETHPESLHGEYYCPQSSSQESLRLVFHCQEVMVGRYRRLWASEGKIPLRRHRALDLLRIATRGL